MLDDRNNAKPCHVGESLQDAIRERDEWKESCHYWKHKYQLLYREYMHVLSSTRYERCRNLEDGELCAECSNTPWKRCT